MSWSTTQRFICMQVASTKAGTAYCGAHASSGYVTPAHRDHCRKRGKPNPMEAPRCPRCRSRMREYLGTLPPGWGQEETRSKLYAEARAAKLEGFSAPFVRRLRLR